MCKRALPESFWKEPTTIQTSSLSSDVYSRFPPLFSSDNNNGDLDITEIRPLTPPGGSSPQNSKKPMKYVTSPPDTELLFSLFDQFDNKIDKRLIVRRGRFENTFLHIIDMYIWYIYFISSYSILNITLLEVTGHTSTSAMIF